MVFSRRKEKTMGYLIDPTKLIYETFMQNPQSLADIQSIMEEEVYDLRGFYAQQTRSERIERLSEWVYSEISMFARFNNVFVAQLFNSLMDSDMIDWDQLEYLLYEGAKDED